jgi:hypothetical protein
VKLYDLLVDGYHTPLTAAQIGELFHAGRLRRTDPCKEAGHKEFRTLDELFPLLKYDSSSSAVGLPQGQPKRTRSTLDCSDILGDEVKPPTSALKAGWICFGFGLLLSWIFPLGNAFFSIAIITAIVAMCTHQVNRGLALLISSFVGIGLSVLVFFTLVVGAIGAGIEQAHTQMKRMHHAESNALAQLNVSNQKLQAVAPNVHASFPATSLVRQTNGNTASRHEQAIAQANRAAAEAEEDRAKTRESVRQAERQRDRINEKQKQIERLQKSLDWHDEQVRNVRAYGGNDRLLVEQRDQLLKQKWELEGR